MLRFERSFDRELVRGIMCHPEVWPHLTEDGEDLESYQPCMDPRIAYVVVRDGDELLGLWMFVPQTRRFAWEVHVAMLPGHGARRARTAFRELARLIWAASPARVLIAQIPEYNRLSLQFAKDVGFMEFGRDSESWEHGGKAWGRIYLELRRPESAAVS